MHINKLECEFYLIHELNYLCILKELILYEYLNQQNKKNINVTAQKLAGKKPPNHTV